MTQTLEGQQKYPFYRCRKCGNITDELPTSPAENECSVGGSHSYETIFEKGELEVEGEDEG